MAPLRRIDLARAFVRSLFLQATWSFERMQTLGFAYAMDPALARLHGPSREVEDARGRHLAFFNTNPVLASVILGCAIRMEEEGSHPAEAVEQLKSALMGPCGAMGDALYWGSLKPLFVVVALQAAYRGELWAPWLFLALFVIANLGGRLVGFWQGYAKGPGVAAWISNLRLVAWSQRLKGLCAFLLGTALCGLAGPALLTEWEVPGIVWAPVACAVVLALAWLSGKGVSPHWLAYLGLAVSIGVVAWT